MGGKETGGAERSRAGAYAPVVGVEDAAPAAENGFLADTPSEAEARADIVPVRIGLAACDAIDSGEANAPRRFNPGVLSGGFAL
jgi:hypothetical protein